MLTVSQDPGLGEGSDLTVLGLCCLVISCPLPLSMASRDPMPSPWLPPGRTVSCEGSVGQTSAGLPPQPLLPLSSFFPVFPHLEGEVPFSSLPLPAACSPSLTQARRLWNLSPGQYGSKQVQMGPLPGLRKGPGMCPLSATQGLLEPVAGGPCSRSCSRPLSMSSPSPPSVTGRQPAAASDPVLRGRA